MTGEEHQLMDFDHELDAKNFLKLLVGIFNYASNYENITCKFKDERGFNYAHMEFTIKNDPGKSEKWMAAPRKAALKSDIYCVIRFNILSTCKEIDTLFNFINSKFPKGLKQIVKNYLKELDHSNINYKKINTFLRDIMREKNTNLFIDKLFEKLKISNIFKHFDDYFDMYIISIKKGEYQVPFSVYNLNLNIKKEII